MTGKRERNKRANRAAILAAARDCIIDKPYDAITVRDIVRRTPLAAGTFYNYYTDKESVYRELLHERMSAFTEHLTAIRQSAATLREFLYETYLHVFYTVVDDPLFYGAILANPAQMRSLFDDSIMGMSVRALEADIRDAIKRGLIPDDVDVEYLAAAFFGVGFEIGRVLAQRERKDAEHAAALAEQIFLDGIAARAGHGAAA